MLQGPRLKPEQALYGLGLQTPRPQANH